MTLSLGEFVQDLEKLWPVEFAEPWDSVGLTCGDLNQPINRVMLTVDVTAEVLGEASGFDLILSHHPLLLKGVTSLSEQSAKGSVLSTAIRQGIALYAAHTNADSAEGGVSDSLAAAIGLAAASPLVPGASDNIGTGRLGDLIEPVTLLGLAQRLANVLPATATGVRVSGNHESAVKRIALCGGAGDAFIEQAYDCGADVYITSDLRHHPVQEAREKALAQNRSMAFIDISHWAAEWIWLQVAAETLSKLHPSIEFTVCELRTDPWDFVVTQ